MSDPNPCIIRADSISKSFGGVPVLQEVSFDIRAGEIHTLMGENGAGKSTLMKILAGVHRPDGGKIILNDREIHLVSPQAAIREGIALIHQEPLSFPDLSVAENIFLGRGLPHGKLGQVDWRAMRARAAELLGSLGVRLDPKTRMRGLSIADQQMVELAAALSLNARVLLMDEPTAALTPQEVQDLFRIVRQLRDRGVAIVFVSHRLPEVFEVSDRITVLRDGHCIGTRTVRETTTDEIVRMMVGRPLSALYEKPAATVGTTLLRVESLSQEGRFHDINFEARAGEIVGIAGLVGAGRTDLAEAIFGVTRSDSGAVYIDGSAARLGSPRESVARGLAYVPEDRQHNGLLLPMSIAANTTLADLEEVSRAGVISRRRETTLAETWKQKLGTRLRDVHQPAAELSGGNQQKVVLSKWLLTGPRILIVDEPTRGIDIGAKAEVHQLLAELARQGKAIVMISSDLPEVLAMSDRVLVMRQGRIAAEFARGEATQERVMAAATGTDRAATHDASGAAGPAKASRASSRLFLFRELGILAFVILAFVVAAIIEPRFRSPDSIRTIALYSPIILIVAIGQLMVIVSRNIDLSVGSMLGLAAIVTGGIFVQHHDFPLILAALIATLVGAVLGALNGTLVAFFNVPSIIATLGTYTAYRGLIYIWSGGRQVDPNDLPTPLIELSQTGPLGIPWIILFAIIVAILGAIFL
ncbi:MAG TPA: ATP-binding cassette domain-containing protein, partial [Tepidisphaeraceae bacterium]